MNQFLVLVEWSAPEFDYHEKSSDWYWALGIITFGFFVLALLLKNWLFAILVVLGGFSLGMYGVKRPRTINFAVTSRGLKIGETLYPFDHLQSFWLNYDPPHLKELYVISKKKFVPQIFIPLGQADPNLVREHLLKFMEEREIQESFVDVIARFFRF